MTTSTMPTKSTPTGNYLAGWIEHNHEARYCNRWLPTIPVRDVANACVLIHGLGDHGGRYQGLGQYLNSHSIALQACDLPGHGRSPGKRGCIRSYANLIEEVRWSVAEAQHLWPNAEITLVGQSMGGNLALKFALEQSAEQAQLQQPQDILSMQKPTWVQRVVTVAPMLIPRGKPIREDHLAFGCRLARWIPNMSFYSPSRPQLLSDEASKQQAYRADKLVHHWMSIRLGIELTLAGREIMAAAEMLTVPTLVIHAVDDPLAELNNSVEFCSRSPAATLMPLAIGRHEPLLDAGAKPLWSAIAGERRTSHRRQDVA